MQVSHQSHNTHTANCHDIVEKEIENKGSSVWENHDASIGAVAVSEMAHLGTK